MFRIKYFYTTKLITGQKFRNNDPTSPERDYLPLETFTVLQNRYYRFRTINAGFDVGFEISIDDVS